MGWPTLADLSRLPLPGTDAPGQVEFTPDGSALTYLVGDPGSLVQSLWRHDLASGERVELAGSMPDTESEEALTLEERLQRERQRRSVLGVTEYAWLPRAVQPTILVPMGGRAFAAVGAQAETGVRPVAGVVGAASVIGSPTGGWVAFVRDGDVFVAPLDGGELQRLTGDATDGVSNGLAEYAASEELGRFEGMWWSWDGRHLAFAHVDERDIPLMPIAHLGEADTTHEVHRYPLAGGPNARVTLRVADIQAGGIPIETALSIEAGGYLARVVAHPGGGWLVATLPRHQRELRWSRLLPDGAAHALWKEPGEPWVNLDDDTRVLPDGRVLRSTERSGFRHLELRSLDGGEPLALTGGEWMVTRVVHVDASRQVVYFMATRDGATERHLYRASLAAAALSRQPEPPERLTSERGWHDVVFSQDGSRWADTWSDLEHAPRLVARSAERAGEGAEVAAPRQSVETLDVRPPELLTLTAADGSTSLHAALYRPERPAAVPPPCVVWVYGGPHAQYVKRAWEATVHPLRQYLSRAGVAVLAVDNRGSAFRGVAFERSLEAQLGAVEVADQAAAVRQLAERGEIDITRLGVTGGSYGGFMTLRAMALEPDLFRVGVAVAPVTDWRGYDTAYTERYLGMPDADAAAYADSSALEVVSRVTGSLLLIHGAIDENVHLRHSLRLVGAMQAAGRDVELVVLPTDRHRVRSAAGLATRDRRTLRHLLVGLDVPLPPELADS